MSFAKVGHVLLYPELNIIYNAIVNHEDKVTFPGEKMDWTQETRKFKGGTLYAVDYQGMRYVEQNKNTSSAYAKRAVAGAKIIWVIRLRDNEYMGRIEDGVVYMKPKARSA